MRVATARNSLSLLNARSAVLRVLYSSVSNAGGRPPWEPLAAGGLLVALFGDGGFDPASPQVGADLTVGVRLVGEQAIGSGPGPARPESGNPQPVQERLESQRVVALPGGGHPGQWSAPGVRQQVTLRA